MKEPEVSTEAIFAYLKTRYPSGVLIVPGPDGVAELYSHGMTGDCVAMVLYQIADRLVAEHGSPLSRLKQVRN